jgi:hypothetical protein
MPLHLINGIANGSGIVDAVSGSSKESRIMLREALEWCESMELLYWCEDCNNTKDEAVFIEIMTINISQSRPTSETSFSRYMSCST